MVAFMLLLILEAAISTWPRLNAPKNGSHEYDPYLKILGYDIMRLMGLDCFRKRVEFRVSSYLI